jgi:hypothetical protein
VKYLTQYERSFGKANNGIKIVAPKLKELLMTKLLLPISILLIVSCSQKTIESVAKSDSQKKLTKIINKKPIKSFGSLISQPALNKIKGIILDQCVNSSETMYLGTFKGFDDSKSRMISIEYMSCNDTWTLWTYKVIENRPQLFSVWVDKLENREKNTSKFAASETWQ